MDAEVSRISSLHTLLQRIGSYSSSNQAQLAHEGAQSALKSVTAAHTSLQTTVNSARRAISGKRKHFTHMLRAALSELAKEVNAMEQQLSLPKFGNKSNAPGDVVRELHNMGLSLSNCASCILKYARFQVLLSCDYFTTRDAASAEAEVASMGFSLERIQVDHERTVALHKECTLKWVAAASVTEMEHEWEASLLGACVVKDMEARMKDCEAALRAALDGCSPDAVTKSTEEILARCQLQLELVRHLHNRDLSSTQWAQVGTVCSSFSISKFRN